MFIPSITTVSKTGVTEQNLLNHAFNHNRSIFLNEAVTESSALALIVQLDYLDSHGKGDITLYINSPGGSVSDGFAIIDAMNRCQSDIRTVATGLAASMAAVILSCGTRGKRLITPYAEVMIHQPLGGIQGQASDIELESRHIVKTKQKLCQLLAENTGKSAEAILSDSDRNYFLDAAAAVEYGLVDGILE